MIAGLPKKRARKHSSDLIKVHLNGDVHLARTLRGRLYSVVLFALGRMAGLHFPGSVGEQFAPFGEELKEHNAKPGQITDVSMDMSRAFIAGAAAHLPGAAVTYDKFHVVKLLNEALDKVRRAEQKKTPLLLKRTRYLWLNNPESHPNALPGLLSAVYPCIPFPHKIAENQIFSPYRAPPSRFSCKASSVCV